MVTEVVSFGLCRGLLFVQFPARSCRPVPIGGFEGARGLHVADYGERHVFGAIGLFDKANEVQATQIPQRVVFADTPAAYSVVVKSSRIKGLNEHGARVVSFLLALLDDDLELFRQLIR